MNPSAHITSYEALPRLHDALAKFAAKGQEALATADAEVRHVLDKLRERLQHWQRQVNRCNEDVNRARSDLAFRRSLNDGKRTGCVEQEIALARAQQHLREAEAKVVACRRWLMHLPEVIQEFERPARQLAGTLDADMKVSLNILQNKIAALEAYADLNAPPSD
jgi:chromosome segregation ATPase